MSWAAPDRDPRSIGSKLAAQGEYVQEMSDNNNDSHELGKIIPITMPMGYPDPLENSGQATEMQPVKRVSYDRSRVMRGENIKPEIVSDIEDHERELAAGGDIAKFVDFYNAASAEFQGREAA